MTDVWAKLDNKNSLVSKGTQYRNMQAWSRPCALCKKEFVAYTPGNAPADKAPTVTTCEDHRGAPTAIRYGWLAWNGSDIVPGPKVKGAASSGVANSEELEAVKKELAEAYEAQMDAMREAGKIRKAINEQLGLSLLGDGITYETVSAAYQKLFAEIQVLKAKLAPYEAQSAMEAVKPFNPHELLAQELAKNKFPWGS